jgi:hypothetical protein
MLNSPKIGKRTSGVSLHARTRLCRKRESELGKTQFTLSWPAIFLSLMSPAHSTCCQSNDLCYELMIKRRENVHPDQKEQEEYDIKMQQQKQKGEREPPGPELEIH